MSPDFKSMRPERLKQKLLRGEPAAWNWLKDDVIKPTAKKYVKKAAGPYGARYEVEELVDAALSRVYEAVRSWQSGNLVGYLHRAAENAFRRHHTEQHAGTAGRSHACDKPIAGKGALRIDESRDTDMLDFAAAWHGGFVSAAEIEAFEAAFDVTDWKLDSATFLRVLCEAEPLSKADAEKRTNAVCARVLLGSLAAKDPGGLARLIDAAERAELVSHEDAKAVRAYLALEPQERSRCSAPPGPPASPSAGATR